MELYKLTSQSAHILCNAENVISALLNNGSDLSWILAQIFHEVCQFLHFHPHIPLYHTKREINNAARVVAASAVTLNIAPQSLLNALCLTNGKQYYNKGCGPCGLHSQFWKQLLLILIGIYTKPACVCVRGGVGVGVGEHKHNHSYKDTHPTFSF